MHEDTTYEAPGVGGGISRRDMLRKSAVVGGAGALMWAAPSITTYGARAFAGTPSRDLCPVESQPSDLLWKYVGGGCDDSSHDQDPCDASPTSQGDCFCWGQTPNGASLVTIRTLGGEGGTPQEDEYQNVGIGQTFLVPAGGGRAGASQRFKVYDGENLVHEVQVHTSCSQPLRIGDRFGAFELIDGTASSA